MPSGPSRVVPALRALAGELRWDVRHGGRLLRKERGFTLLAVATLALAIGPPAAIFSVVHAVLLRPLPYAAPEDLVTVLHDAPGLPAPVARQAPVSPADYLDLRANARAFTGLAAAQIDREGTLGGGGEGDPVEAVPGLAVTANLFDVLGVRAAHGQTFAPGDDQPGARRVVLLSHALVQRRYHGDVGLVGRTVLLGGAPHTVLGVLPPAVEFPPFWSVPADYFVPLGLHARASDRDGRSLRLFARLAPGVTRVQAQAEMEALWAGIAAAHPASSRGYTLAVDSLHERAVGKLRRPLYVLFGAVTLVLLIGCANLANLLLARGIARRHEVALKTALGASRARLLRQLLSESVLLALCGGVLGLGLAALGIDVLRALAPPSLPRREGITLDGAVLAFTAGLSLATGVLVGILPALRTARDGGQALRAGTRGGEVRSRLRELLVVAEVALALVLLIGAGLMWKSFVRLTSLDGGFDPRGLLAATVTPAGRDEVGRRALYDRALARVRTLPGVSAASAINHLPIEGDMWSTAYVVLGGPVPLPGAEPTAVYRQVRPDYFATMGIVVRRGRPIGAQDQALAPLVVVINQALATQAFAGADPIGRQLLLHGEPRTVVGVVGDVRQRDWARRPQPEIYYPDQQRAPARALTLVVRTSPARQAALAHELSAALAELDRRMPVPRALPMIDIIAGAVGGNRLQLVLFNLFAGLALLLAAIGVYGVISYGVSRRTREIGVRVALGASAREVVTHVLRGGLRLAVAGVALGLVLALVASGAMTSLLHETSSTDAATFVLLPVGLLALALLAAYLPARRATRIDPMVALRSD